MSFENSIVVENRPPEEAIQLAPLPSEQQRVVKLTFAGVKEPLVLLVREIDEEPGVFLVQFLRDSDTSVNLRARAKMLPSGSIELIFF